MNERLVERLNINIQEFQEIEENIARGKTKKKFTEQPMGGGQKKQLYFIDKFSG